MAEAPARGLAANGAIQCGKAPKREGAQTAITWEEERRFEDVLVLLRSMNVDLDRETVMAYANAVIKGSEFEKKFPKRRHQGLV
jgi:hypothetical protein